MNFDPTQVNTTEENANDYVDKVNVLLAQNSVVDKDGNPAQLAKLAGSPTWLLSLAQGQLTSEWQERLRNSTFAIDVANCSDEQLLNLATIAGIIRKEESAPIVSLPFTNTTGSPIFFTRGVIAVDGLYSHNWYCGSDYILGNNESAELQFYCDTHGIELPAGTPFTVTVGQNILTTVNAVPSMILGANESIESLRNRILYGEDAFDSVTQTENAIRRLPGISFCSIVFNESSTEYKQIGTLQIPPRQSFIAIQGVDVQGLIGKQFFTYMNTQTMKIDSGVHKSLVSSVLVGSSVMSVYYSVAPTVQFKIRVSVRPKPGDNTYAAIIARELLKHANDTTIGQQLTSQLVDEWLGALDNQVLIVSSEVAFIDPNGVASSWGNITTLDPYYRGTITEANISVVVV